MKIYHLQTKKPAWHFDPATNRQIKLLKFFGHNPPEGLTKGAASGSIVRLFTVPENQELWEKYLFHTGDTGNESADLAPFDWEALKAVQVPPKEPRFQLSGGRKEQLREMIADILRDGTPFDEPVPEISFQGKSFAFTGKFTSGSRNDCNDVTAKMGGEAHSNVKASTDFLVIGLEGSDSWSQGSHGHKIEKAMMLRLETGKPAILSEHDWIQAVQKASKAAEGK